MSSFHASWSVFPQVWSTRCGKDLSFILSSLQKTVRVFLKWNIFRWKSKKVWRRLCSEKEFARSLRNLWFWTQDTNIIFKYNRQCLWQSKNGLTLWLWEQPLPHLFVREFISHKNTGIEYSQNLNHFLTAGLYQNFHILVWNMGSPKLMRACFESFLF